MSVTHKASYALLLQQALEISVNGAPFKVLGTDMPQAAGFGAITPQSPPRSPSPLTRHPTPYTLHPRP
eukprot:3426338-Rhodomonas_salina.1